MILIFLVLLLALLPLVLTTSFPHLVVVSIYSGLAHLLAFGWAIMIIIILLRRRRIREWREARKLRKQARAQQKNHPH
jgi:threonine/homoserine/homoserine lactone efflux protein